jgi:hypothetical protein
LYVTKIQTEPGPLDDPIGEEDPEREMLAVGAGKQRVGILKNNC